jgi:hypothetical protein
MSETIPARVQLRRGTAAQWTAANPVLLDGEVGYERDTGRLRIGDGSTTFTSLPFASISVADLATRLPRDGSAAMQAALPMGGFRITGLAAGTAVNDATRRDQTLGGIADQRVNSPSITDFASVSGTVPTGLYRYSTDSGDTGGPAGWDRAMVLWSRRAASGGETQLWMREGTPAAVLSRSRGVGSWSNFSLGISGLTQEQAEDPASEALGLVSGQRLNQQTKAALNVSGDAPMFACRAWVNFDGTTTPPTIRASGNVASVVRNGANDYTVNFSEEMPHTNFTVSGTATGAPTDSAARTGSISSRVGANPFERTLSSVRFETRRTDNFFGFQFADVNVTIFA